MPLKKNVDEIETCWRQMQASIGNMDEVINACVLRWRLHTVDDDMKERLNRPKYIDCGPGKCGSTVVIQDGCKKAIVPREELLGKRKWADLSSSKKQMLVRSSPLNKDNKICSRCHVREVWLTNSSLRLLESNRGHVNILINDWIVYEDRLLACARSGTWPRGGKVTIKIADVQDDQNLLY